MAVTKKKVALVAPVKRFSTKDGELVEIRMNRKARQAEEPEFVIREMPPISDDLMERFCRSRRDDK